MHDKILSGLHGNSIQLLPESRVCAKCMARFWLVGLVGICYVMHPGVIR